MEKEIFPGWVHAIAIAIGWIIRKAWLYVCAPAGLLCFVIAWIAGARH